MPLSYRQRLFGSAALVNLGAGLALLAGMQPLGALLGLEINATAAVFYQMTMAIVLVFAWVFWMIARDPQQYRPFILLSVILKILVVAISSGHWLAGNISWQLPALLSIDILYAALFWRYYQQQGRNRQAAA
jgi:hypothetical protein